LFVMFPDRAPGIGLLLLRLGLAAAACCPWPTGAWQQWLVASGALLMAVGWLTPLAVAMVAMALCMVRADPVLAVIPLSLWLLGPGAYSVDACLFGRRVLVRRPPQGPPKE